MTPRRRIAAVTAIFLAIAFAWTIRSDFFLNALGETLVNGEAPQKADAIVVLCGDYSGKRILRGAELVRLGFAPVVLMSGGTAFYDTDEPHAAAQFAILHGYDPQYFAPLSNNVDSTTDEAEVLVTEMRRRGIHRYLLVTNAFHSARAARVFRRLAPDLECHPVIADDDSKNWWRQRPNRKGFFFESLKTVADRLGI